MVDVAVVGAGVGGLASAIRLASAGRQVEVYERNALAGGKLASMCLDDFTFDIGPSLLTMPSYIAELGVELEPVRLHEPFRYEFANGQTLVINDDAAITQQAFDEFSRNGGAQWRSLYERGERIWNVSERTFLAGPMTGVSDMLSRMNSLKDFADIDPLHTLHWRARRTFRSPQLQQWLDRYATYSGSSPFQAPATLACIPYLEQRYGAWHLPGGLATLATAMQKRAEELGVIFHFNTEIAEISRSLGLRTQAGEAITADAIVANVDAECLYGALLPDPEMLYQVKRAQRSTAAFSMLLAVEGVSEGLRHHNILFSRDYRTEFDEIERYGAAREPTVYVCCASKTDPTLAPRDHESWFVMVNVKAGHHHDWQAYGDRIIEFLGIADRVRIRRDLPPSFYDEAFLAPGGAIYGTSSNGKRSAFLRAPNRGAIPGLYLVGGSSHPGGGIPMVLSSARIVGEMILGPSSS